MILPESADTAKLINKLLYEAVGERGQPVAFLKLAKLCLPLCRVRFAGEAHYLVRVGSSGVYYTACGGELGTPVRAGIEPTCAACKKYEDQIDRLCRTQG